MTEIALMAGVRHFRAPSSIVSIATVAQRELRDAIRSRWFILYTLSFVVLGLGVSYISAAATGSSGMSGFGRTTAGLINLVILVVPLMALTAGAGAIASDRERGMLAYVLSQPLNRWELLAGKFLGLMLALVACICAGFGLCAAILAYKSGGADPGRLAILIGLSVLLAVAMLGVGMLISVVSRKAGVAVGIAVFTWLLLVFVTDLGLMAGAVALRLKIQHLFFLSLANPLQVFKMWALHAVDASLDVLGPAGLFATDTFGGGVGWVFAASLAVWAVIPLAAAGLLFSRRSLL